MTAAVEHYESFRFEQTKVRVFTIDGRKLAVGADVCAALDIKNARDALSRLEPGDRLTISRSDTVGCSDGIWNGFAPQVQSVTLISENGATDLILESRKPEARRFRHWLTHTVWPAIRDTGSYGTATSIPDITTPEGLLAMTEMFADTARKLVAVESEKKMLAAAIERDAPLVAKAEAHTGSDSDVHRQEFAREVQAWGTKQGIEIKQADVLRFLGHIGLFIRGERSDTGHATADAQRRGLAFTHKDVARNGYAYAVGKLTPSGQDYAWKRITKYVGDHGSLELPRELRGGDPA
ncbi:hypothetical protein PBI_MOZY_57 [Mycobacterium phage Mozy]|uniref:Bro-N domain-containing protein n=1 Tax=Mycobacterium phage Mozy TaxID=2922213 RepID=G1D4H1_9CAUD|nr:anti-repressor Ant [Mycobacterium phage Mozy]AEK09671.1 hypothetical protein PBI_MOZY_57 [Mycobacterium phage Mozy]